MSQNEDHRPGSDGEHRLQDACGTADRARSFYERQLIDHLNPVMRAFLGRMEMMFVASADGGGECDCSIRCGPPGFVHALDEHHLAYPEYRGNGVMASLGNVSENAHVGLLFVDFFRDRVGLHVNGAARVVETTDLLAMPGLPDGCRADALAANGRRPERWVLVRVHEAYIHCSKHIPLLAKLDKRIPWGTDGTRAKGGDYFGVTRDRAGAAAPAADAPTVRTTPSAPAPAPS
jgi:predicted pyridoxine 5'-phosphate oxidase superfamily flavin-nucleotide-binding protein